MAGEMRPLNAVFNNFTSFEISSNQRRTARLLFSLIDGY